MTLTVDERRQVASLQTVKGYQLVLSKVVETELQAALGRLTTSMDRDEVWRASIEYQLLKRIAGELTHLPQRMVDELKEEGDEIYGVY